MENNAYLSVKGINKQYPGVKACDDVHLKAYRGEALGLIGINGAGKSTLMNILAGEVKADSGEIEINGVSVHITNQKEAEDNHIALIHQEAMVFPMLSVAENVFITNLGKFRKNGRLNYKAMCNEAKKYLGMLDSKLDPRMIVDEVTAGGRQMIEIARALSQDAEILLFDEPTSSLSIKEKEILFEIIESLKAQGKIIIYITHFIEEIKQVCERVVVMMDGHVSGQNYTKELQTTDMVRMMVGQDVQSVMRTEQATIGDVLLRVENLGHAPVTSNINFELHAGEVVGMWGLLGSGRTEIVQTVLGLLKPKAGRITFFSKDGKQHSIRGRKLLKYAGYVTENRLFDGVFKRMPIYKNITMPDLAHYTHFGFLSEGKERMASRQMIEKLAIKTPSEENRVDQLSGGNQQKVIISRWILKNTPIYILDEPTRGVDVGAKAAIHQLILELAAQGNSILMISSEIEEILALCDRTLIIRNGTVTGEVMKAEMTNHNLMMLAVGEEGA